LAASILPPEAQLDIEDTLTVLANYLK